MPVVYTSLPEDPKKGDEKGQSTPPTSSEDDLPIAGYVPKPKKVEPSVKVAKESKNLADNGESQAPADAAPDYVADASVEDLNVAYDPEAPKRRVKIRTGKSKRGEHVLPYSQQDLDEVLEAGADPAPRRDELVSRQIQGKTRQRVRATKEAVEYRRKQILRLMLRGVPKQTIADHLGLTLKQVYEDVTEINRDMRLELQRLDVPTYIGMSLAFYEEARNISLRMATDNTTDKSGKPKINVGAQLQALRVAMMAEQGKHEFMTRVGLFKIVAPTDPFNSIQTGRQGSYTDENDMNKFMQSIAQMAKGIGTFDTTATEVPDGP